MEYLAVKWLHIISSTLLFGTGIGSAFCMLCTTLTRDTRAVAVGTRIVVIADWLFTTPTAVIQPLTGFYLIHLAGFPMTSHWIRWSLALYAIAIACWLPVVWLQMRMRDVAVEASRGGADLPAAYWFYFRWWAGLGFPAFFAFLAIFWLMVAKTV